MFCPNCRAQINDNAAFCPECGQKIVKPESVAQPVPVQEVPQAEYIPQPEPAPAPEPAPVYTEADDVASIESWQVKAYVKIMAIISYLGATVFLPMFIMKRQKYVRSHANNGLVLLIFTAGFSFLEVIPIVGWILGSAGLVFLMVLEIMGIVKACKGSMFDMPLLGKIKILK